MNIRPVYLGQDVFPLLCVLLRGGGEPGPGALRLLPGVGGRGPGGPGDGAGAPVGARHPNLRDQLRVD
jgi:hypothetical protein